MKIPPRLIDCLNESKIGYETLQHPEGGIHTDAIKLSYRDYEKIGKPRVEDLAIKIQPVKLLASG
jgi:hypothetical protein